MGKPLYNTDIIPLTSRPTLAVMDDGDYFAILDTSTGNISKILKTNLVLPASQGSYNNATSGLTATQVQAALDELVVNLGSSDNAISAIKGTGYTDGTLKTHEDRLDTLEADDTTEGSVAKTVKDAVDPVKGTGWTDETVKGNADDIALKENLANKKSTLVENSETYYPNQKAVNDGLNLTMAEMMGFAPRNLMDVFGTSTVAETFQALRTYCNQNGPYNTHLDGFRKLRLGDYIDLPSLTIGADSVKPSRYPARTINNDYNRLRVEIVGFDDYYQVANTVYPTQHHVTMMFKDIPTTAPFNETNTTKGDYSGSMLFHWLHEQFESALITAINGGGATVVEPLAVDRRIGTVANWEWVGSEKIFLPTSVNIFGTTGFSHTNYGTGTQTQFALFALNPNRKIKRNNNSRSYWWLAEPSANTSTLFCFASHLGDANNYNASNTLGVVPAFLI